MAYALALAIAAGTLVRRTIPAMAVTVAGFVGLRIPILAGLRPQHLKPVSITWDPYLVVPKSQPGRLDWQTVSYWANSRGSIVDPPHVIETCAGQAIRIDMSPGSPFTACTHARGWLLTVDWQPADRFWALQGIESAIFLVLAALLLAVTIWWVRRRLG